MQMSSNSKVSNDFFLNNRFWITFYFHLLQNLNNKVKQAFPIVLITWLCLTFCDPMVCSPPDSFVHGILQARNTGVGSHSVLQDIPDPGIERGSPALQADSLPSEPPGKPNRVSNFF